MPRQRSTLGVDMFPFLSVLCSIIGVLMLFMMIVMSTRVIEAEERDKLEPEAEVGVEDGVDADVYDRLAAQVDELTGKLATRLQARDELRSRQDQLLALVEEKRAEIDVPLKKPRKRVELDKPEPVNVVPDENSIGRQKPIYIEVKSDGYLVQPEKLLFPVLKKRKVGGKDTYTADAKFNNFLKQVDRNRSNQYLLLLVHPNGVEPYWDLRKYLFQTYKENVSVPGGYIIKCRIGIGTEPYSRDWEFIANQPSNKG